MSIMRDDDQNIVDEDGNEGDDNDEYEKSKTVKMSPQRRQPNGKYDLQRNKRPKRKVMIKREDCDLKDDPLVVCGFDIMLMILSRLDAHSVASTLLVSRRWCTVASNDVIWSKKCEELWKGKAHLPRISQIQGLTKLSTFLWSMEDGKRSRIKKEDLCDHAWEFHFRKEAPEYWRNLDPVWKGTEPSMRRYFLPDGSQTADPSDPVWGGHECCYTIVTSFLEGGKIREHYVRINRWPKMKISRRKDWGWEMSNHLYCYSSIPDAYKIDGTGPNLPPS